MHVLAYMQAKHTERNNIFNVITQSRDFVIANRLKPLLLLLEGGTEELEGHRVRHICIGLLGMPGRQE